MNIQLIFSTSVIYYCQEQSTKFYHQNINNKQSLKHYTFRWYKWNVILDKYAGRFIFAIFIQSKYICINIKSLLEVLQYLLS